jgi:transposase
MNAGNLNKWLEEKRIPNLDKPSVVVMDNASYHCVVKNKAPTTRTTKPKIKEWLTANNIHYEEYHKKDELLVFVDKYKPEPVYAAENILQQHGHEVLRLPPYHCDLNPIELIWSLAKRKIAKKNVGLSAQDTEKLIHDSFANITADDWRNNNQLRN